MSNVASIHLTDFHVGWGDDDNPRYQKIDAFIDYVTEINPVFLGLVGDEADPWEKKWEEIINHPTWIKLQKLVEKRSHQGLRTVWIHENHDYNAKFEYLPGAELVHGKVTLRAETNENPGVSPIILIHGWQWDAYWGGILGKIPGLAPVLFGISTRFPWMMLPLNRLYSRFRTPFKDKQKTEGQIEEKEKWDAGMIFMHGQARSWAIKQKAIVIFGHTHYPDVQIDERTNFGILNTGDWVDSFSYIIHEADKPIPELRFWEPKDNGG